MEKRDLVFLWINDDDGIFKDQNVNFGSEYVFRVEREGDRLKLSAEPDTSYIPDFFSAPGQSGSISNLTAFVGKNGTGKTILCKLIANVFGGQSDCEYVSVVRIISDTGSISYEAYHSRHGGLREGHRNALADFHLGEERARPRPEILDVDASLDNCRIAKDFNVGKAQAVYYSPIVDFSNTEFRQSYRSHVDISGNHLLITAVENQMSTREKFDRVDLMNLIRAEDFHRQYEFVMSQAADHILKSASKVDLHTERIWVEAVKLKHDVKNEFWNIPITFQDTIRKVDRLYDEELRAWQGRLGDAGRGTDEAYAATIRLNQERMVLMFTYYMFTAFLYNLNLDNTHQAASGHAMPHYEGATFIDGVRHFFQHQGIVDPVAFLLCIEILQNNESRIEMLEHIDDEIRFTMERTEMMSLFINHLNIELELSGIHHKKVELRGHGFMKFEWGIDPSSGEKAYLDLYSRLFYARKMMKDGVGWTQVSGLHEGYPDQLIIILDEAEVGFHPAWQQEFVANLTAAAPNIFSVSTTDQGRGMYSPNWTPIQLVIATHSPIALSDIPLNHTFFLERVYEEGKYVRKVMRGADLGIQHTFGANIHDLYRNSFFLTEHMLGNFAHDRIQVIIDDLNREDVDAERARVVRKVIDQIGEPVIRAKLTRMYEDKFGDGLTDEERERFYEEELRKIRSRRKDEDH